jgi:hypothetical protein
MMVAVTRRPVPSQSEMRRLAFTCQPPTPRPFSANEPGIIRFSPRIEVDEESPSEYSVQSRLTGVLLLFGVIPHSDVSTHIEDSTISESRTVSVINNKQQIGCSSKFRRRSLTVGR